MYLRSRIGNLEEPVLGQPSILNATGYDTSVILESV